MVCVKFGLAFVNLTNCASKKEKKYKYLGDKFKCKHEYQII